MKKLHKLKGGCPIGCPPEGFHILHRIGYRLDRPMIAIQNQRHGYRQLCQFFATDGETGNL
ncbi:MAG: hypothetical protein II709_06830 [Ruminococcus sp.]|nr:hypothetical protein [Ruminococcus sp.]